LVIGFQDTVENVGDVFFGDTEYISPLLEIRSSVEIATPLIHQPFQPMMLLAIPVGLLASM